MFVVGQAVVDCAVWTKEQEKGTLMSYSVPKAVLELIIYLAKSGQDNSTM